MTAIPLSLPKGSVVTGEILRDYSAAPKRLSQDMLQVSLPTGATIDVGWWPAFDPAGSFQVVIYRSDWDNKLVNPIWVKSPYDAVRVVQQLAERYSTPVVAPTPS